MTVVFFSVVSPVVGGLSPCDGLHTLALNRCDLVATVALVDASGQHMPVKQTT